MSETNAKDGSNSALECHPIKSLTNAEDDINSTFECHPIVSLINPENASTSALEYHPTLSETNANNDSNSTETVAKENLKTVERLIRTFPGHSGCLGSAGKRFRSSGDDLNDPPRAWTLLHSASLRRDAEVVRLLIVSGADVNAKDRHDRTPIYYAVDSTDLDIVKQLLDHGASTKDCPELIQAAVKVESRDIVEILLQHNIDVNSTDKHGRTALHLIALTHSPTCSAYNNARRIGSNRASAANKVAITELLIAYGAQVDAKTNDGLTALHVAAQSCSKAVLKSLLAHGADINSLTKTETTPLHCAVDRGNRDIVEILLSQGADPNASQKDKSTALHIATEKGFHKIVEMLLEYGADIDAREKYGRSALHLSSIFARLQITDILLAYGADVNITCQDKCTALNYANLPEIFANLYPGEMTRSLIGRLKDSKNLWNYRQVSEVLRREIIKMKILGLFVNHQNLMSIDSTEEYEALYYRCRREIDLMRFQKIGNSKVSFFDIVIKSIDKVAMYAENRVVERTLETDQYRMMFPMYSCMISASFRRGQRRKRLLHTSTKALNYFVGYPLPRIVSSDILSHLSTKDMQNLMKACVM